jgi:hypothetical protein
MPAMGNPVGYELADFTITLTRGQVMAGMNTVTATNVGSAPHEVNFVRAPSADSLPRTPTGGVDFTQVPTADQLGVLRVAAGTTGTGMFSFTPGSYVVLCNVGAAGTNARHQRARRPEHVPGVHRLVGGARTSAGVGSGYAPAPMWRRGAGPSVKGCPRTPPAPVDRPWWTWPSPRG